MTAYLNAQIEAGAQAVMIFDSWGGVLSHGAYHEVLLAYMQRIVKALKEKDGRRIPCIVFTKGGGLWIESIADIGCDAVGLDWTMDIGEARASVGHKVALQGNLDPNVLFASPEVIHTEAIATLDSFGPPQRADGSGMAMSSTSATASPSTPTRTTSPRWSRPCIGIRAASARCRATAPEAPHWQGGCTACCRLALSPLERPHMLVSEHSGIDLSPKTMLRRNAMDASHRAIGICPHQC